MSVCMYVYIYISIYLYIYTYMCVCVRAVICVLLNITVHAHILLEVSVLGFRGAWTFQSRRRVSLLLPRLNSRGFCIFGCRVLGSTGLLGWFSFRLQGLGPGLRFRALGFGCRGF